MGMAACAAESGGTTVAMCELIGLGPEDPLADTCAVAMATTLTFACKQLCGMAVGEITKIALNKLDPRCSNAAAEYAVATRMSNNEESQVAETGGWECWIYSKAANLISSKVAEMETSCNTEVMAECAAKSRGTTDKICGEIGLTSGISGDIWSLTSGNSCEEEISQAMAYACKKLCGMAVAEVEKLVLTKLNPGCSKAPNCEGYLFRKNLPQDWCSKLTNWAECGIADGVVYGSGYGCTFKSHNGGVHCKTLNSGNECNQFQLQHSAAEYAVATRMANSKRTHGLESHGCHNWALSMADCSVDSDCCPEHSWTCGRDNKCVWHQDGRLTDDLEEFIIFGRMSDNEEIRVAESSGCYKWTLFMADCEVDSDCCPEKSWTCGRDNKCIWHDLSPNAWSECDIYTKAANWIASKVAAQGACTAESMAACAAESGGTTVAMCELIGLGPEDPLADTCAVAMATTLTFACKQLCGMAVGEITKIALKKLDPRCSKAEAEHAVARLLDLEETQVAKSSSKGCSKWTLFMADCVDNSDCCPENSWTCGRDN